MRIAWLLLISCWVNVAGAKELPAFEVDSVLSEPVKKLSKPQWWPGIVSWRPAISTSSEEAQKHFAQGMALIHAGWDFEAYRHFCEAAKADPECLMAYFGISLSLAEPNAEVDEVRIAALDRMFDLVEAGVGTEFEQAQVRALAFLFSGEREKAPEVFRKVSDKFPNDLQTALMAAYLDRDGYDYLLGERPGQRKAVERVEDLLRRNPESQMALLFWVLLHAEHPDGIGVLRSKVLPRARKLIEMAPDFPPYRHLLGHFEWRAGNLSLAEKEFAKASELFAVYMREQGVSYYDCPNWLQSKLYHATSLKSLDKFDEALAIAKELGEMEVKDERIESQGAALMLWEGKTLAARLYLAQEEDGSFQQGLESLPAKEEGQYYSDRSPAVLAWEGWRNVLASRNAIQRKVFDRAKVYLEGVAATDELLVGVRDGILGRSCRAEWLRARRAFSVQAAAGQGLLIVAEDPEELGKGQFWMQSAIDRQAPASGLTPPILLTPTELRLALLQAAAGNHEAAAANFEKALARFPNDLAVLEAVAEWSEKRGNMEQAKDYRAHMAVVKGE